MAAAHLVAFGGVAVLFAAAAIAVGRMALVAWASLCDPAVVAGLAAVAPCSARAPMRANPGITTTTT